MAKFSLNNPSFTTEAVADGANRTDATYLALLGGSSTQRNSIIEVYAGGQATSSAPQYLLLARDSTVGGTLSGGRTAALDAANSGVSSAPTGFTTATTKPQRSSTLSLLNLTFNAFGGIVRWVAAPGEEIYTVGNTASLGEIGLSGFTGTTAGLIGAHIIFEPA